MNAVTPVLTELAFKNASLLRAIRAGGFESISGLATSIGRDKSNVHKSVTALTEAGLLRDAFGKPCLTYEGTTQVEALDRADLGTIASGDTVAITFDRIDAWPANPRTQFDDATTEDLARSIGDQGVLQPLVVRAKAGGDRYEVIIGERRRRASTLAVERGWQPADFAVPCRVRELDDAKAEEIAGVENIQREDMHWMDEAKWLKRLAERGRSGSEIERIVGGARKKRSIQDYIKIARELSPQDMARTYLPDGAKDQLTYVHARDLVGEKKERPALDLTPRTACALLEVIAAGIEQRGIAGWAPGETIVTRFQRAPAGGPLGTLQSLKLLTFGFDDSRKVVARTPLSEDVTRWLKQLAFGEDPAGALYKARAVLVGEMHAAAMSKDGENLTVELNALISQNAPPSPTEAPEPAGADAPLTEPRGLEPFEDARGGAEREAAEAGEPEPPPPTPAAPPELPAMLAIVVVEAAHKIAAQGVERGAGTWGVPVLTSYYKDNRGQTLVIGHKMIAFLPNGEKTLVALGKAGRDWLWEKYGVESPEGRPQVSDEILARAQMELLGARATGGLYSTPWLNPPAEAAAAPEADEEPSPPSEGASDVAGGKEQPVVSEQDALRPRADRGDDFTQGILGLAAERRAITSLAAAARQAKTFVESLKTRSKAPKAEEIAPIADLLTAALDAIAPHLNRHGEGSDD